MDPSNDTTDSRPRQTRSRRRQRSSSSSSSSTRSSKSSKIMVSAIVAAMTLLAVLHHQTSFLPSNNHNGSLTGSLRMSFQHGFQIFAEAKEIVATSEWQLLGENDTIPAGLHVRMDLSTGEKWVKLASSDEEDGEEDIKAAIGGEDKEVPKVESAVMDASGALSIIDDNSANEDNNEPKPPQRDYEMMHRVMSQLPPEELERFGGLPELPHLSANNVSSDVSSGSASSEATPSSSGAPSTLSRLAALTPTQRQHFENQMENLWTRRQEALKEAQEMVADLPSILKERISTLKGYLEDVEGSLNQLVEDRKSRQSEGENLDEDGEEEDQRIANNVIEALKDLEFQLSDVDMARDFHTLGGWPYLVSLLDEEVHKTGTKEAEIGKERMVIVHEIRALSAMTIGTAMGNLGEFRPWALEDVSSSVGAAMSASTSTPTSALSMLIASFQNELEERTQSMAGGSMAIPATSFSTDVYKAHATYKLRAIYALGALLRGNPTAQQYFVSKGGAEILVSDVLGTLSNVRGLEASNKSLLRLDYKFASKVLALGEDVAMDVVLHEKDYVQSDTTTTDEVSANQLVGAFTSDKWCDLSLRMLAPPTDIIGATSGRNIKERAMSAVRALGPGCKETTRDEYEDSEGLSWGVEEVRLVRSEWNGEGDDDLDEVYRKELLELADGVLDALQ